MEGVGERNINVWLPLGHPLPGQQLRHVPWLGIELAGTESTEPHQLELVNLLKI